MFEKYGEFGSAKEINEKAKELKEAKDVGGLKALAMENGIDVEIAEAYLDGEIDFICNEMSAAIGKLEIEAKDLNCAEIMEDWVEYVKAQTMEKPELAKAVRKKGKSLKGAVAQLLIWAFKNQTPVDAAILKAAGVKGKVSLGIPGMARAKQIITDYYLGK